MINNRRNKMSPEEIQEVFSKPLELFPEPSPEAKAKGIINRAPLAWQKYCFPWEFSWEKRLENFKTLHCHPTDNVLVYSGAGTGKCLGIDTPILMYDGSVKRVQDVVVGDLLMGPDSNPRKVKSLGRGREEMFRVIPKNGHSFVCNRSHILSLRVNFSNFRSKRLDMRFTPDRNSIINISVTDYLSLKTRDQAMCYLYKSKNLDFKDSKDLPIDPYFIGLWLADGTHYKASVANIDQEILDYLDEFAALYDMKVWRQLGKPNNFIVNKKMGPEPNKVLRILKSLNLYRNKHIPDIFLYASKEDRLKLLAGLLDGDGTFSKGGLEFCQKREKLTEQVVFLIRSLGFRASVSKKKKDNCFYVRILGDFSQIPIKIKRKQGLFSNTLDPLVTRFSLESLGEGDYYGFEIEGPDRLFLLGDFTVTHNTNLGIALNLWFMTMFPGCQTLTIAQVYNDIEQIILPKLKDLLSINEPWDYPAISHLVNKQDKFLDLTLPVYDENGKIIWKTSRAWFGHASDFERLRGKSYTYIHAEELSQFTDERAVDEFCRRLRETVSPFRMFYATTNPPESTSHFMYNMWDLTDQMPNFEGDRPKPKLCTCQYCSECFNDTDNGNPEFLYDDIGVCTNPNCSFIKFCIKNNLPQTRYKKPSYEFRDKHYSCPGNQTFWRVLSPKSTENIHNPSSLTQELKAGHDEANFSVYVKGEVRSLRTNKVYHSFKYQANTNQIEIQPDPAKDLVWTHDHNLVPRCSVIVQEEHTGNDVYIDCLNEIVRYTCLDAKGNKTRGAGPEHVAEDFIKQYKDWNHSTIAAGEQKTVLIHGDHTALNGKMSPMSRNEFQIYNDMLTEAGFKVQVCVRKIKGQTQIPQVDRLILTNWMLKDAKGISRIRINKRCRHLLKSFEDLEGIQKGDRFVINKTCDDSAAKATNTDITHLVSHPSDALGYYLSRCFNLVKEGGGTRFAYIAGGGLLNIDYHSGTITQAVRQPEVEEEPAKTKEEIDHMYTEAYLNKVREYIQSTQDEDQSDDLSNFMSYYM